jgi:undecaprenyl-diphosphatase
MDLLQAFILGLVEGITEYLPVSSTGHLLLAEGLMRIPQSQASNSYAIAIQGGAILAVLGLYRARVGSMLEGIVGRDADGRRLLLNLVAAFVPTAVLGKLFNERIEHYLFGAKVVIAAWVVGGILILALTRWTARHHQGKDLSRLTWKAAAIIGLAQSVAMWPGTSRSLVTILAALALGLSMAAAVEFSFLLGVITLTAAAGYTVLKDGPEMLAAYGWPALATGFIAAWIFAALAVKWMVAWLNRHGLGVFAWWRFAAAGLATLWLLSRPA